MTVTKGIEKITEGLVGMLKGDNFGKAILTVAEL
jgi:NADPH-dependent curcumin reductase CurA